MAEPDDTIISMMSSLSACLCAQLAELAGTEEPPTCFCTPILGEFPGQAYIGKGTDIAWVRLFDMFPSSAPGQRAALTLDRLPATSLMIELGVMRCFSLPKDGAYSEQMLHDLWVIQMRDVGALQRAISCCTGRTWEENQIVVGNYVPMGPQGDLFGGMIPLAVQIEV